MLKEDILSYFLNAMYCKNSHCFIITTIYCREQENDVFLNADSDFNATLLSKVLGQRSQMCVFFQNGDPFCVHTATDGSGSRAGLLVRCGLLRIQARNKQVLTVFFFGVMCYFEARQQEGHE